jgi:hypothetical protein
VGDDNRRLPGRVNPGAQSANKAVVIERIDIEIRVVKTTVIPVDELWLHRNQAAIEAVLIGLAQAKAHKFSMAPPRIASDFGKAD